MKVMVTLRSVRDMAVLKTFVKNRTTMKMMIFWIPDKALIVLGGDDSGRDSNIFNEG